MTKTIETDCGSSSIKYPFLSQLEEDEKKMSKNHQVWKKGDFLWAA